MDPSWIRFRLSVGILNNRHKQTGEHFAEAISTMTELNRDAAQAAVAAGVRAATDVTGFGLLGHLFKMCRASGADAFLFGRRTYDLFLESWGTIREIQRHPVEVALNSQPKYVASRTFNEPEWATTTILGDNLLATSRTDSKGVMVQTYRPGGPPHYATS